MAPNFFIEFREEFVERDYLVTGIVDQFFHYKRLVDFRPYIPKKVFVPRHVFIVRRTRSFSSWRFLILAPISQKITFSLPASSFDFSHDIPLLVETPSLRQTVLGKDVEAVDVHFIFR